MTSVASEAVRNRTVVRFGMAGFLSVVGDGGNSVAVSFAVLAITTSPVTLSFVLAARLVGLSVAILAGGVVADRVERRSAMVVADIVRFVSQGALALALLTGHGSVVLLAVTQLIHGVASGFFLPASGAYLPSVVPSALLQKVNGVLVSTITFGGIVGPVVGGVLTSTFGAGSALGLDAITFLISAALLLGLPRSRSTSTSATNESFWRQFSDGFHEVWRRPWLRAGVLFFLASQMMTNGPLYVLGPIVAEQHYNGATTWGLLMGALGVGGVAGGLVASRLRTHRPFLVLLVAAGVPVAFLFGLGLQVHVGMLLLAAVLAGVATTFVDVTWWTLLQRHVPSEALSRVLAWDLFAYYVARPASMAIAGPLVVVATIPMVLVGAALGLLVAVGVTMRIPAVRSLQPETSGDERQ